MSLIFTGLAILMIGDSHLYTRGGLESRLHDELMDRGAKVYSYGACGSPAGDWATTSHPPCGKTSRIESHGIEREEGADSTTPPLSELIERHHPNLIIVVNGDTMASYKTPVMPSPWIAKQVSLLTKTIQDAELRCIWIGPTWGSEGGKFGKTQARTQEISDFLADNVAPCDYINSLGLSRPGEFSTVGWDGQHLTERGYNQWAQAIAKKMETMNVSAATIKVTAGVKHEH